MTFLLSKKFIAVGGGLLVIVVGSYFVVTGNRAAFDSSAAPIEALNFDESLLQVVALKLNSTDSDSDGLKDWEEELWGTDPENPDTDGDGVKDGIEVDTDRNPTVPGPDDALGGDIASFGESGLDEDLTVTDQFARNFFSEYLRFKKSGLLESPEGRDFLVRSVGNKVPTFIGERYRSSDLIISPENSLEAVKTYGNSMGSILERVSIDTRNEAVILLDALQSDDPEILKELEPIETFYRTMGEESLKVVVPESAVNLHLALLTSFRNIEITVDAMEKIFEDPLYTASALGNYQQQAGELGLAFQNVTAFFAEQDITFESMEPGYTFTHILDQLEQ